MNAPSCRACGDQLPRSQHALGLCRECDRARLARVCGLAEGRRLRCTRCGTVEHVLEAAMFARTDEEHRYLDERSYVGTCCLRPVAERKAAA